MTQVKRGLAHASRRLALCAGSAVLAALYSATPAVAATRYWSANGSTAGGTGTWNTTATNRWAAAAGGPWNLAWVNGNNDVAENSSATAILTLGANITLGGFTQKAGGSSTANRIEEGSGPFTLTLGLTGNNTFSPFANDTTGRFLIINAAVAGAAGKSLLVAGPATSGTGTLTLNRANTFSGATVFSGAAGAAKLALGHALALQNSTLTLSAPAVIQFSGTAFTLGGLAADSAGAGRNLTLQNGANAVALTVGNNNSSTRYAAVLSGSGSLIKTGGGTLQLTGTNTYTGPTAVNGGTLQVDGIISGPVTVNSGAVLAGCGRANRLVTVNAGGTITAGDGTGGRLTVSNLTFAGTGAIRVGNLPDYASAAALIVSNALSLGGGAGAVTVNLPTAPGFNGAYHLIRFGSGPVNTDGFTLGSVPVLAWNQTGTLRVNGNDLDYVITAAGDTTPPTLKRTLPANNATDAPTNATLVATFDETVVAGAGTIELRRSSDASLVEAFDVATSSRLAFSTAQLSVQPTGNMLTNVQYYVVIPFGAVTDTSGNSFAGITGSTGWRFTVAPPVALYTDTGSPANPPWSEIYPTLNFQAADPGPVYGSLINVNNAAVEAGLYGNRPLSVPSQRIHVACNTSTANFGKFTRWFQTDGNTQVLRVFVNDHNTANDRTNSLHNEAFMAGGWNYTDNVTYEWTARYTIAHLRQGYAAFQLKNVDNDWAVQLSMSGSGTLTVNNRTGTDAVVTEADGSAKNFNGRGFDVRVLDDGLNYKVWVDGVLYAARSFSRPTGTTTFRWGKYYGENKLNPPADYELVLVSGAQIKSWPGTLSSAVTAITKTNNTTNLNIGSSWVGGVTPGLYELAVWDNTVAAANTTTLASDQQWAGLRIENPGGTVTINGSALLGLDASGVDLSAATQNLIVNGPVRLTASGAWSVAPGRTAAFNGSVSGFPGLTLNGGGTLSLSAANTYGGETTINAGTLAANNNSALGTGRLVLNGGTLSNSVSCTLGNDVRLNANATVAVGASQTLTLSGSLSGSGQLTKSGAGTLTLSGTNTHTGATLVNAGKLAIGDTSALLATPSLTLANGTVLQPDLDGAVVQAPITVGGGTATVSAPVNAPGGGVVSTLTLNSVLSGSGNVTFSSSVNQNALSTVYLGGQSTYAGSTRLDTAGTTTTQVILKLGTHNALPTNTVLTIDGQAGTGTGRFAELNLNGFSQTLAGLTAVARTLRVQRIVNSDVSAPATLTVNNASDYTFSGSLGSSAANGSVSATAMPGSSNGGNFGLVKGGAGILQLTGTNRYTGDTAVRGGTLQLQSPDLATNSTISIESGAVLRLDFTGTNTVWGLITNGVVLAPGVYHAGNAAPFIAGQGRLRVDEIDPPPPAVVWSGGSAPDLDWPNAGNWLPVAVPGKITDVRFIDLGATSDGVSANNIVPAKMAVRSLAYAQTNGYHHTLIRPGVTLTVSNDASGIVVQAGTETQVAAAQQTTNVVSGAGGTLKIVGTHSGSAFVVRESHATVGPHRATLDLSDLDRLELAVGQLAVAVQGSIIRPAGTLLLARTNTITLAGTAPSLALGDGSGNGGNALLRLGLSNALFTDSVLVSGRKSIATMQFNPAFTGDNPSLMLRGRSASRVSTFAIGDNAGTVNSGITTVGTVDWSGGTVDVLADTLVVGRSQSGAGAGAASGTLTFSAGTLDVNTLELGYQVTNTVSSVASGTVNVNGTATLRVNASLRLARHTGAGTAPAGTLNVKGGTLYADSIVTENPGTSALTVTNGTLCVASHAGTAAAPLGTLRLSNARLELPVASGLTNLFVNTLLADPAATNRLLITALPTITGYPARFALLRYATLNAFAFELDALPGTAHLGSLSNNAAAGTVELIVTPAAPPQFASVGSDAGGSFALSGSGPEGATYRVFATTNLTLPFSAWTEVATGSFSGGVFTFTDTQATNFPQRFYRTVTP